jgi:thiol-disulfide isomerase/thioredoxin
MRRSLLVLLAAGALAAGCGPRSGRAAAPAAGSVRDFPAVQVPGIYTDAKERESYALEHFWDRFFAGADGMRCDSVTVCGVPRDRFEGAFSSYIALLQTQDPESGRRAVGSLFDRVESAQRADTASNVHDVFADMMELYLYDPNSPFRNEDLYQPYVAGLARSPFTDPAKVPGFEFDARMCALNSVGTPAADFRFADAAGRTRRLYDVHADYTLLFFSNPGCTACKEIIVSLKGIPALPEMISSGRLAVVNVYIDQDLAAWREYLPEYPKEWYNGYDPAYIIRQDILYNIRGIPSLYVLDKDKKVIMKDAPEERVFAFLGSIDRD